MTISDVIARPKSAIEEMGERCLQVCRDHMYDKEADARLIADFMWALGVDMTIEFVEARHSQGPSLLSTITGKHSQAAGEGSPFVHSVAGIAPAPKARGGGA